MVSKKVIGVSWDKDLLPAVRERARQQGRSLSAHVRTVTFAQGVEPAAVEVEVMRAVDWIKSAFSPSLQLKPEKGDKPGELGYVAETYEWLLHKYPMTETNVLTMKIKTICLLRACAAQRAGREFTRSYMAAERWQAFLEKKGKTGTAPSGTAAPDASSHDRPE